ncbi:sigma-54 interaction domain-containing protein [Sulfidibacter corallicola]|uniref:Sigma-54-dependent Fis family transcriptional regulator n=1 Tax=Sulfidibacter corallicola TaxID=2818388 RepID=A0A8A4TMY2_SULCO|nr:sigma-54 dependent transcriptional regulator [Sulfidibacter corallicola]QTD47945.1 sigma-54-dependent Fis family transcriptional regulator [Sulfidibacter corallicola]
MQLLNSIKTLVDSLVLVDDQLLPPSFSKEVLNPVSSQRHRLEDIQNKLVFHDLLQRVSLLRDHAEDRHWYFWDTMSQWLCRFANAEQVQVFQENGEGTLTKVHPLEAEEDIQEYHLPGQCQDGIHIGEDPEWRQNLWIRLDRPARTGLVLRFLTRRPAPLVDRVRLHLLKENEHLLRLTLDCRLPNLNPVRVVEILGQQDTKDDSGELFGRDTDFLRALESLRQAAVSEASVYLSGESGTGKELFARHLHKMSKRATGPFIPINCSAIPHELIESEMFGHEKGAFTGAYYRKIGKVEQANGGTLFLDEIGEMPLAFQAKLLRYLQEKKFNRVGGNQAIGSDARIVVATHRDLKQMVAEGTFREDLFYRIHVIPIAIPPLRNRGGDIRLLSEKFFAKYIKKSRASRRKVDEAVFEALERYRFPGNVRELDNIIHRTVVMTQKPVIGIEDLPEDVLQATNKKASSEDFRHHPFEKFDGFVPQDRDTLKRLKKEVEIVSMSYQRDLDRRFLLGLLRESGGSARKAAELAGINRTLFYKLLKRAGIDISLLHQSE